MSFHHDKKKKNLFDSWSVQNLQARNNDPKEMIRNKAGDKYKEMSFIL